VGRVVAGICRMSSFCRYRFTPSDFVTVVCPLYCGLSSYSLLSSTRESDCEKCCYHINHFPGIVRKPVGADSRLAFRRSQNRIEIMQIQDMERQSKIVNCHLYLDFGKSYLSREPKSRTIHILISASSNSGDKPY